jgi:predicted transcriptional regulator
MELFKDVWPICALLISIGYNIYQSGNTRNNNKQDKETDAINKLNSEMLSVNTIIAEIKRGLQECEKEAKEVPILRERIDNTKTSLTDIKNQMNTVQGMVQTLIRNITKDKE